MTATSTAGGQGRESSLPIGRPSSHPSLLLEEAAGWVETLAEWQLQRRITVEGQSSPRPAVRPEHAGANGIGRRGRPAGYRPSAGTGWGGDAGRASAAGSPPGPARLRGGRGAPARGCPAAAGIAPLGLRAAAQLRAGPGVKAGHGSNRSGSFAGSCWWELRGCACTGNAYLRVLKQTVKYLCFLRGGTPARSGAGTWRWAAGR